MAEIEARTHLPFAVEASEHGEARLIIVTGPTGERRVYELPGNEQQHYAMPPSF